MSDELVKILLFMSRHAPNDGQIELARKIGYEGIKQIDLVFSKDPVKDLKEKGIKNKTISIVAPSYITNILLNAGYTLIEFVNSPVKRGKMVFCCEGAYIYSLKCVTKDYQGNQWDAFIEQRYVQCPISIEEQVESSLVPTESREVSE